MAGRWRRHASHWAVMPKTTIPAAEIMRYSCMDALCTKTRRMSGSNSLGAEMEHPGIPCYLNPNGQIFECAVSQHHEINRNIIGERIVFGHLMFNGPSLWLADVIEHQAPVLVGFATAEMESSLREEEVLHLLKDIMSDSARVHIHMYLIRSMSPPVSAQKASEMISSN